MRKKALLLVLAGLVPLSLLAHGIQIKIEKHPPFVEVEVGYGGREHLSQGQVVIFGPGDKEDIFQTGRTDVNGRFSFIPDRAGPWTIAVDDGFGHKKRTVIAISEVFFREGSVPQEAPEPEKEVIRPHVPSSWKALWGVGLIFGLTGIYYWFKARKILNRVKKED